VHDRARDLGSAPLSAADAGRRLARRALEEIYAGGNLEAVDELIDPGFVDHEPAHPGQPAGPEAVRQTVGQLHDAFGELRFEVHDEIAEGDKVVQVVTMSGRHTGSLMGREPTGRRFAVRHIYIWRIAAGRLVEHWGSRDDLGLLAQLGLLPGVDAAEAD
jgi:predicted ester cyclase